MWWWSDRETPDDRRRNCGHIHLPGCLASDDGVHDPITDTAGWQGALRMTTRTDTTAAASPLARSRATTWGLIAAASLISTGLAAYEIAPASVSPLIQESLGVTASRAGLLVGIMFGAAVIVSLPAGAVLDRTNSRQAVVVAVGVLVGARVWGWVAGRGRLLVAAGVASAGRGRVHRRLERGDRRRESGGQPRHSGDGSRCVHCQRADRLRARPGH